MKKIEKLKYFPLLIDLSNKNILVVGAGNVATRKVETLLDYDCNITVLAPMISDEIKKWEALGLISIIYRSYKAGDSSDFDLVFSAIDDKNAEKQIYNDCWNNKIPLNVADVPELCSFIMPANIKRGNITISIASQGKSPFLVKDIKNQIDKLIPDEYSKYAKLAADFRQYLISNKELSEKEKTNYINSFLNSNFIKIIQDEGYEVAEREMIDILNKKKYE